MKMYHVAKSPKVKAVESYYIGDIETPTTNTKHFMSGQPGRILCMAIQKMGDFNNFVLLTHTMWDFEHWLINLQENATIFFHNIAFDGLAIIDWARNRWNSPLNNIPDHPITWYYKNVRGKVLTITLKINHPGTKKRFFVKIQCSYRLLMQSVNALGAVVQMPKLTVQTYDLEPVNRLDDLPQDFILYLKHDVIIVNKALCQFKEAIKQINQRFKLDVAWDSLTSASISRQILDQLDKRSFTVSFASQQAAGAYYRGGFTALNQAIKDQIIIGQHQIMDAKSHYPSVIFLNDLPSGEPEILKDPQQCAKLTEKINKHPTTFNASVDFITVEGTIIRSVSQWGAIPWPVDIKNFHPLYETYIVTDQMTPFIFKGTIREWLSVIPFYEFQDWKVTEWVRFGEHQRSNVLKPVIKYLYDFKEVKDEYGNHPWKMTFKIILNSLYGSMGMDQDFEHTVYVHQDYDLQPEMRFGNKEALYYDLFLDRLNFFRDWNYHTLKTRREITAKELTYSYWNRWVACYITSIGRSELLKLIAKDFDRIYYCDTDSLIGTTDNHAFKWLAENDRIGSLLGQWDYELLDHQEANILRIRAPKNYDVRLQTQQILKQGTVGVDKKALNEILATNPTFLDHNTIIPNGWKHMIYGVPRENFEYDANGRVVLKKTGRVSTIEKTDFFPYIISQDKSWTKLQNQRGVNDGKKN